MLRRETFVSLVFASSFAAAVAPGAWGDTDTTDFRSVGKVFSASAVLVGPDLVLTAKHVGAGSFTLPFYGTFALKGNAVPHPGMDLLLFRIDNRGMSLPFTRILCERVADGSAITMVGFGLSGLLNGSGTGYDMVLPRGVRRKANAVVDRTEYMDYGTFLPGFCLISILRENGQGALANGDSGGGCFRTVNGSPYLVGINSFIDVWGTWTGANAYQFSSSQSDYFASGAVSLSHATGWLKANGAMMAPAPLLP